MKHFDDFGDEWIMIKLAWRQIIECITKYNNLNIDNHPAICSTFRTALISYDDFQRFKVRVLFCNYKTFFGHVVGYTIYKSYVGSIAMHFEKNNTLFVFI